MTALICDRVAQHTKPGHSGAPAAGYAVSELASHWSSGWRLSSFQTQIAPYYTEKECSMSPVVFSKPIRPREVPKQSCQDTREMWGPHPGCEEFMTEPEAIVLCVEPATHRAKYTDPVFGVLSRAQLCTYHARDEAYNDCRIYRFRTVK